MNERSDFFLSLGCLPGTLEQVHEKETLDSSSTDCCIFLV